MIVNENVFPHADERQVKAMFEIYDEQGAVVKTYLGSQIIKANLIQECYVNQSTRPKTELRITIRDEEGNYDVSNKDGFYYTIAKSPFKFFVSSVPFGIKESYMAKNTGFVVGASLDKQNITIKSEDILQRMSVSNNSAITVFNKGDPEKEGIGFKISYVVSYWAKQCGSLSDAYVPEDIDNSVLLYRDDFMKGENQLIKEAILYLPELLKNKTGLDFRLFANESGQLVVKPQRFEVVERIPKRNFIDYEILNGESGLIISVRDRGNLLRQLTDVVEIDDGGKILKAEIYKQTYEFQKGMLSATWEGVLI